MCQMCMIYFTYKHCSSKRITSSQQMCKTQTGEFSLPVPFVVFSIFFSNSVMFRRAHTCVSPVFVVVAALLLKAGMIIFASNGEERQKVLKNTRVYIVVRWYDISNSEGDRISSIVIIWICVQLSLIFMCVCVCLCIRMWAWVEVNVEFDHQPF